MVNGQWSDYTNQVACPFLEKPVSSTCQWWAGNSGHSSQKTQESEGIGQLLDAQQVDKYDRCKGDEGRFCWRKKKWNEKKIN